MNDIEYAKEKVWVIIPAFNEETVLGGVVQDVLSCFKNVIVIDDFSTDNTGVVANNFGANVIRHPINLGQGAALQTGFDFALKSGADYIVTLDADGQHNPQEALNMLLFLIESKCDVVLGSRFIGHVLDMPTSRRLLLKAALLFTRLTTGLILTDTHNGLRVFRSEALRKIRLHQNRMAHASEILDQIARANLKYQEFGNTVKYTEYSLAKGQKASNAFNILADLFIKGLIR
jgi:glycosyltransferase involved in cell wall biosynthesis